MTSEKPDNSSRLPVAIMFPLNRDESFDRAVADAYPEVDLRWTPYMANPPGSETGAETDPQISDDLRQAWADVQFAVGMDLVEDRAGLLPAMKGFQVSSAGYEHLDVEDLRANQIRLATASGVASVSIAEFVMGRALQVYKRLRAVDEQQDRQEWRKRFGTEVSGLTMAIIGFGAIGRELAIRARAFGMTVIATRGSAKPGDTDPDVDEMFPAAELDSVLAKADIVVAALPANDATADLFDADRFALMKPGSVFCNVGRGSHVIEPDLIAALESEHLRAAILDVAKVEPLPEGDPLWDAPNLYLSPHCSVSLDRYEENVLAIAFENIGRFLNGEAMRNEVTFD